MSRLSRLSTGGRLVAALALGVTGLAAQAPARALLEAHAWGGYSAFLDAPSGPASDKAGGTGLRMVELAVWPARSLRLFGRYDNSLSLDNLTLLRAGRRVPTWSGGALLNWNEHHATVAHAGRRSLPGGVRQVLVGMEQVAYLHNGMAVKAGADVGRGTDDRTEWVAHAGVNVPVHGGLRMEPVVFYARSGYPGESQWRALVAAEQSFGRRASLGLGVASGRIRGSTSGLDGTVWDSYARLSLGVGGRSKAHVLARHERSPGTTALTSVALGLSLVLSRP